MNRKDIVITSSWVDSIHPSSGWEVLRNASEIKSPSIWIIDPAKTHSNLSSRYDSILSIEETTRGNRFHQTDHRVRYKATHAVLRLLLASVIPADPATFQFRKGYHHKPFVIAPKKKDIEFSVSYTESKAAIGIADGFQVGIDIEWLRRPLAIEDLLSACFSNKEIDFIQADDEHMLYRFFTLWTRKEAILKLTGEGIGDHLPFFEVLDGPCVAEKDIIGGQPPSAIYLYSFPLEYDFIGCFASPKPVDDLVFYYL